VQRLHDGDVTLASTGHLQLHTEHGPMPAASLADVLGVPASGRPSRAMVLSAGDPVALLVDAIMGEEELVISVVPAPLRRVRYVAGVALDPQGVPVVVLGAAEVSREVRRTLPVPPPGAEGFADQLRPRRAQPVIVVADDSTTTRLLEVLILESAGYEVRAAADARDALRLLDEGDVDALVVDVQMPGFDGVRLCQELRADARFVTLPIILLTALMSPADRERGLAAGADAYLVKSEFDQEQLLDVVHRLVRQ
jgi:two-component system chemotaxis sensor kinase CheA